MSARQVVSGVVGAILLLVSLVGLARAQDGGEVRSADVAGIPVRLYSAGPESPTVIVAHGFAGSAQLMEPLALGLRQAGFTVVSLDFPGHGANPDVLPFSGDVRTATWDALTAPLAEVLDWTALQPEVDRDRIALLGHSMGAGAVVAFAVSDAVSDGRVSATVALSLPSADDVPEGEPAVPRDLLLLHGALEPAPFSEAALTALRAAYPDGYAGITYGDSAEGTARRANAIPGVEHITVLFAPSTLEESVAWLSAALGTDPQPASLPPLPLYAVLALVAGGFLLVPLSLWVLGARPRLAWNPDPDPVRGGLALLVSLVASVVGVLGAWVARPLADEVPVAVGGYLAAWFLVASAVAWLWWAVRLRPAHQPPLVSVRGAIGAIGLALLATLLVVVPGAMSWSAFSFVGTRLWVAVLLLVVLGLWFSVDELIVRRTSTGRRIGLMIASRVIAVGVLLGAIPLLGAPSFLVIIAPLLLLFFVILGCYAAIVARRKEPYLAAVLVQAVPAAVLIATTFPMVG